MSVLVNEFEVVPPTEQPAGNRPQSTASPDTKADQPSLEAVDVITVMDRQRERLARLCAH